MRSCLENRKQYLSYSNSLSDTKTIYYGVPRSSFLSPLLFLLYINYLPNVCRHNKNLLFADDCALYTTTKTKNEQQVNSGTSNVGTWLWSISSQKNKDKTATLEFKRNEFSNKRAHKYLDLMIDDKLNL